MIIEECSFSLEIQTKVFGAKKKKHKNKKLVGHICPVSIVW